MTAINGCDRASERDHHRPHAADRTQRGPAPAFLGQERKVEARQDEERHHQVDPDHHHQRQRRSGNGGRGFAVTAVMDFRGIELACRGRELAHAQVVGRGQRSPAGAITFAAPARGALRLGQPPQTETQHDGGRDDPETGGGKRRGAEERHRDRILDRRRAGQRRHGEGRGPEHDRRGHQPARNGGGAEHLLRHRDEHKESDEQADAAIRDDSTGQDHRQYGAALTQPLAQEVGDRRHRAAVVHELAEQGAEQKQREELREEGRRAEHEGLGPARQQRLAGECGGEQGRRGSEQQYAPAAQRQPDQQRQAEQDPDQAHDVRRLPAVRRDRGSNAGPGPRGERSGMLAPRVAPRRAAWTKIPTRR